MSHSSGSFDLSELALAPEDVDGLFTGYPLPVLLYEPGTGVIVAANHAAVAHYGWSADEFRTMRLHDMQPPSEHAAITRALAHERLTAPSQSRVRHWKKDGEPLEVEVFTHSMRLGKRQVRRAVISDVTARTRAEALFRGVAEQSLTGIYVLQDWRFAYLNPRLAEMFGFTVEEAMALEDPFCIFSVEVREEFARRSAQRLTGSMEHIRYAVRATRRDGSPIDIEIFGSSLRLHGRPALLGTVLDVTERTAAEQALRESESRFRGAFEQAMIGMAITAQDGRFLRANPALHTMLGYSADELLSRTFQSVTHPEDVTDNVELRDRLISGEIDGYRLEKRYVHKSGEVVWAALHVALIRDPAGAPQYFVTQVQDITAQKRAERALGESEAQLRHAQKMEAVGRLAGGVAHDFNNLLTVIGSNVELARLTAQSGEGSSVVGELDEIAAAVTRAATLTRQLLAFSRRQVLVPRAVSLNEVVSAAERMLARVIGADVTLETSLDPNAGHVMADPGQLEQVLMNLVVNARDATPEGGVILISTVRREPDRVLLTVTDTGTGMDEATLARACEPFFTTKAPGKGTGLGLSTVYGIVKQSGGDVSIRSQLGRGTTITVTLPAENEPRDSSSQACDAEQSRGEEQQLHAHAGTVLVVEDEVGVRTVTKRILERTGYRVLVAANGADALLLWSKHRDTIDVVLTDVVMPVMGGRQLAERLTAAGGRTPILFMSGYTDAERGGGGAITLGAPLLQKPFSAAALQHELAVLLES
jgi:two-component system cell cycle sensor histidine kinase/response regulator CckA